MIKKLKPHVPIIYLFSFFLGFGKWDPFGTGGVYFDLLTVLMIGSILVFTDVFSKIGEYKTTLLVLTSIALLFFVGAVLYGGSYVAANPLNIKYLSAVLIFWVLSYTFKNDRILCFRSILLYAFSCILIAVLYNFGYLNSHFTISNGRLVIFEENPNSISSRMAIGFIILIYVMIENPLKLGVYRYTLGLALPSIFFFIVATGSRGSFLAMILGVVLIIIFSRINKVIKLLLGFLSLVGILQVYLLIQDSSLVARLNSDDISGGRDSIWAGAMQIFYDNPFGVGEGGYVTEMMKRYSRINDTHNLFIYLLVCGGVLSLVLFAFFLWQLFKNVIWDLKTGNTLSLIIFIFLIFLASKTGGVMTYLIMWYFFAVINSYNKKLSSPS